MIGYTALAQCYDRFVGADYSRMVAFIDQQLKQNFDAPQLICDVGCGSGTVALELIKKGYDLIGIDGSVDMLNEAMQKRLRIENGDKALFLCQELPDFELYGTVDGIVSTLDTLNYLPTEAELDRLFYWFRNYLNPGGILIFDVNSFYKYDQVLKDYCRIYDEDAFFLTWQSDFDGTLCHHMISVFEREADVYIRSDEEQVQRYYSEEQITGLISKYGFDLIGIYDDYSDRPVSAKTERLTYVAKVRKDEKFDE